MKREVGRKVMENSSGGKTLIDTRTWRKVKREKAGFKEIIRQQR